MSFKIIDKNDIKTWNEVIKGFSEFDVYYLYEYAKAFEIHGDGEPILIYYQENTFKATKVVMKRKIPYSDLSNNNETIYDVVTPYGYGGFLIEGYFTSENLKNFYSKYSDFLSLNNIIAEFTRFHPIIGNEKYLTDNYPCVELGRTVSIQLNSEKEIWDNFTSKNRNMIRKAQKSGVSIKHGLTKQLFDKFMDMYNRTMDNDSASKYYYFSNKFYDSILNDLRENAEIFYAVFNNEIIAMSIMIFANKTMHYHLSGSLKEYRHLAPSNFLLYEAAIWGLNMGYTTFHLGGGLGSAEDNLFKFKASFNKSFTHKFTIGKYIYDQKYYDLLVNDRKQNDPTFNEKSSFFPLYRS